MKITSRRRRTRIMGPVTAATALALVIATSAITSASATEQVPDDASVPTTVEAPVFGASGDTRAVSQAAGAYDENKPSSAVELAAAASATEAVPLEESEGGLLAEETPISIDLASDGTVTASAAGVPGIGLALGDSATAPEVVDGALVQTDVAPSTDVVTRVTGGGLQMVAILADSDAPSALDFSLDLPAGAELVQNTDGSVSVMTTVEVERPLPGELDRVSDAVDSLVGDVADYETLTDAQWAELDAIPAAATHTVAETQQAATIGAAWAVDANGAPVETHYEIEGSSLIQVVNVDADTAYPVVADPAWWWWAATATMCVAQLGGFLFAAAKVAGVVAKISKIIKSSVTLSRLVTKLGGAKATLTAMYNAAKGWTQGKATKYISAQKLADLKTLMSKGKDLLFDVLGVGSCVALLTAK